MARADDDFSSQISKLNDVIESLTTSVEKLAESSGGNGKNGALGGKNKPKDPAMEELDSAIKKASTQYRALEADSRRLRRDQSELNSVLRKLKSPILTMIFEISNANKTYEMDSKRSLARQELLNSQIAKLEHQGDVEGALLKQKELEEEKLRNINKKYILKSQQLTIVTNAFIALAKQINGLVKIVRDTQQQFGITAGDAAKLRFDNLVQSVDSFITTLRTAGRTVPVTAEQIRKAQEDFQAQFGGIIDSNSARELAEQAVRMGITTQQLAEARRVFATQTMGDISSAIQQQDRFIAQFESRGMTAKDAMEFITNNSELLARSGVRFQQSMAKAAAEAKRIGVDLSKVNQVGDNIIGNFEGFLDSMAELGAMGFGFDTFRLAQVAETGDTGALFDELRSQLAMTGKDLTNLRRSEQLALSSAFGMNIEEFQRMAGILEEPVEEKLQKEANGFLKTIAEKISNFLQRSGGFLTNFGQALGGTLGPFFKGANWALQTALLTAIAFNTSGLGKSLGILSTRISRRSRVLAGRTGQAIGRVGTQIGATATKVGTRIGATATGIGTRLVGQRQKFAGGQFMPGGVRAPVGGALGGTYSGGILSPVINMFNKVATSIKSQFIKITGPISKAFTWVATKLGSMFSSIFSKMGSLLSKIPGTGLVSRAASGSKGLVGKAATGLSGRIASGGGFLRVGGSTGLLSGAVGGITGFMQARKEGASTTDAAGAGAVRGGAAFAGAAIGGALGSFAPGIGNIIGAALGGFIGDKLGSVLNEKAPILSKMFGGLFSGIFSQFTGIGDSFRNLWSTIKNLGSSLKDVWGAVGNLFSMFGNLISLFGDGEERGSGLVKIMELVGKVIGFGIITPINTLIGILNIAVGVITWVVDLFTVLINGVSKLGNLLADKLTPVFEVVGEKISNVVDTIKNAWQSAIDFIVSLIPDWMKSGASRVGEVTGNVTSRVGEAVGTAWDIFKNPKSWFSGDDMVSRPGYGERTLVTPTATVALNNDDNIVAYADDMIARNTGIELLSKGAIMGESNNTSPVVNVDMSKLERKLDQLIGALNSMEVNMDGIKVGQVLSASEGRALTDAVFRAQRL